jgi:hemolysin III
VSTTIELQVIRSTVMPGHAAPSLVGPRGATVAPPADWAEELANSLTHALGMVLSIAGLSALVRINGTSGLTSHALGCVTFGVSLVLLYTASTLYHGCWHAASKRVLLLLDHIGIYLLIAGTYTPLALIALRGRLGTALLAIVWASALAGILGKIGRFDRLDDESPWSYVALGWMVLVTSGRIAVNVPPGVFQWLLAGGVFYTLGLGFFLQRDRRFSHAIWHLFVLAGSICHYRAVIGFALPTSP